MRLDTNSVEGARSSSFSFHEVEKFKARSCEREILNLPSRYQLFEYKIYLQNNNFTEKYQKAKPNYNQINVQPNIKYKKVNLYPNRYELPRKEREILF